MGSISKAGWKIRLPLAKFVGLRRLTSTSSSQILVGELKPGVALYEQSLSPVDSDFMQ